MSVYQSGQLVTVTGGTAYRTYPAGGAGSVPYISVPTTVANTFGAWTEFTSSTASEIAIVGVQNTSGQSVVVDIGTGGAGSEVSVGYVALGYNASGVWVLNMFFLPYPIIVPAGTRVAVRQANANASSLSIALAYIPTANLVVR